MNIKNIVIAATLATTISSASALAGQFEQIEPSPQLKAKVDSVLGGNAQSITYFDSGFDGLTAITLVSNQLKKHTFYSNDTGDFFMAGNLIDGAKQVNLTPEFQARVNIEFPEDLKQRMDAIPAVVQGESDDNVIYAVIDANCGFCHRTYSSIANHFASGEFDNVEVRWIPVGFLGEDSKNKAFTLASLIEAQPQEAEVFLSKIMTRQTPSTPDGLIVKRDNVVAAEKLMREYGFSGVPFVLMRNGDNWKMNPGMPQKEFFTQNLITTQTDSLGN